MGCFVRSGSCLLRASPHRTPKTGKSHPEDLGKKLVFHCLRAPRAHREGTVCCNSPPVKQSIFFFLPFVTFVRFFSRHPGRPAVEAGSSHPSLMLLWCTQRVPPPPSCPSPRRRSLPAWWEKEPSQGSLYSPCPLLKAQPLLVRRTAEL